MHGEYSTVCGHHVMMNLKDHDIKITIDIKHANIPVITDFFVSSKGKGNFVPQLRPSLDHSYLRKLDLFGAFRTRGIYCYSPIEKRVDAAKSEFGH